MDKAFVVAQCQEGKTDTLKDGLALAAALNMAPKVYAYTHAYFSGAEYYNPRLAGAAKQTLTQQRHDEVAAHLGELGQGDTPLETLWCKRLHEHAIDCAAKEGYSLIIKGIEGAEAPEPNDWHLIRHTRTPLMLLTNNPLARGRCVLMAVDLGAQSEDKQLLNRLVLSHGKQLAEAQGLPLHLACVVRVPTILRDMDLVAPQEILKAAHDKYQHILQQTGLLAEQIHLVTGSPELCLYQLSSSLKVKYLVLGARKREGLFGAMIGSTAEAIVHRVRCNLLILPPDEQWLL
ncbi:universal stress protein [Shewanella khirikhana]|uniref:Universal stress protein E n=1 Tax=Shewanella khirikhana TaxID=1965282 RepID=A0ABM7CYR4_9GAMM|nr:universal stress protein [Shewanella khirikhana]AZQ09270.1 Universal stress protein E [Shewanella khirikhana]